MSFACRDGWSVPLAQVLLLLREVAARLRLPLEHVTYSLELAVILDHIGPMGAISAAAGTAGVVAGLPVIPPPPLQQPEQQQLVSSQAADGAQQVSSPAATGSGNPVQGGGVDVQALLAAAGPALDPKALCTSAVQALLSGVSEISRTPIIKSASTQGQR
jgi:hypothetical protein